MTDTVSLELAAESYARRNWSVFPLHGIKDGRCTCGNDCSSPGKHPRTEHGNLDATTDIDQIRNWWQQWPDANIGLLTGVTFDVLDVDGSNGYDSLEKWQLKNHVDLNPAVMANTGKGTHALFQATGQGNRSKMLPNVDWRGIGGYIVAPPSMHANGVQYSWFKDDFDDIGPAPAALLRLLSPEVKRQVEAILPSGTSSYGERAMQAEISRVVGAGEGSRNDTLNRAAFACYQLVAGGELSEMEVTTRLERAGYGIGLTDKEIQRTLASARKSGFAEPRSAPEKVDYTPVPLKVAAVNNGTSFADRMLTFTELKTKPQTEWLVDEVLAVKTLAVVRGKPGVGKSFVALDLAMSIATGHWWLGKYMVQKGPVIYIAAEGSEGFASRIDAWCSFNKYTSEPNIRVLPEPLNFLDAEAIEEFAKVAKELAPKLIVVDTVARSLPGGEENSSRDMGMLVEHADLIKRESGATILLVAHTDKGGTTIRGHSSLEGAVNTEIALRASATERFRLVVEKQKDGPEHEWVLYRTTHKESCVIQTADTNTAHEETKADIESMRRIEELILETMSPGEWMKSKELETMSGYSDTTFRKAKTALVKKGILRVDGQKVLLGPNAYNSKPELGGQNPKPENQNPKPDDGFSTSGFEIEDPF